MPASVAVAFVNTAAIMPFDCVKTHMEKVDPHSSYAGAFKDIYNRSSWLGFFTGTRVKMLLQVSNALFVVNFLEFIEHLSLRVAASQS